MPDEPRYAIGSELDEFANFMAGLQHLDDGAEAADRAERWFIPSEPRVAP